MADSGDLYDNTDPRISTNKLTDLKVSLQLKLKDVERLTAAIKFLEDNPGAVALINSI